MTTESDKKFLVGDELDDHKTELNSWIKQTEAMAVSETKKKVVERFLRDCNTLLTDLDDKAAPSGYDLCDFDDRRRSLEVQFNNLSQDLV